MDIYEHLISPCCHAITYDAECTNCEEFMEVNDVICFYCRGDLILATYLECSNCFGVFHIDNAIDLEDWE